MIYEFNSVDGSKNFFNDENLMVMTDTGITNGKDFQTLKILDPRNKEHFNNRQITGEGEKKLTVHFDFSSQCNSNCVYCFRNKTNVGLNFEKDKKVIDKVFEVYQDIIVEGKYDFHFNLTGEPFYNKKAFWNLFFYLKKKLGTFFNKNKVSLVTNCLNIDEEDIKKIAENFSIICVSIDGNKETHDKQRPSKTFSFDPYEKVVKTIKALIKNNVNVGGLTTLTPYGKQSIMSICEELKKLGLSGVEINPINSNTLWNKENLKILYKKYEDFFLELEEKVILNNDFSLLTFSKFTQPIRWLFSNAGCCIKCPKLLNFYMSIDEDGNIYECDYCVKNKDLILGNIFDFDLKDFNKKKTKKASNKVFWYNYSDCKLCKWRLLCGGHGAICNAVENSSELRCNIYKIAFPHLINIFAYMLKIGKAAEYFSPFVT